MLFLIFFSISVYSFAENNRGRKILGAWSFLNCTGDIVHHKDELTFEAFSKGLKLTQVQLPKTLETTKVFMFYNHRYWKQEFVRQTPSSHSLQRMVISRIVGGTPTLSSTWSPLVGTGDREFLSSNVAQYFVENNGKLRVKYLGNSATVKGVSSFAASCFYKRAQ